MEAELVAFFGGGLAGQWLSKVLGPSLDDFGQDLRDWIRHKRGRNLTAVVNRSVELASGRNVREIHPRTLMPLLESASLEDEPSLQEKWAALLAHAATEPDGVPPAFPRILSQLTALEVHILDGRWALNGQPLPDPKRPHWRVGDFVSAELNREEVRLALTNLSRLGLIALNVGTEDIDNYPDASVVPFFSIRLTAFGEAFVRACRPW